MATTKRTPANQRTNTSAAVSFIAEIKEVKAYKSVSLDKIYRLALVTDESSVMGLSVLDGDVLVKVTVEIAS